MIVAVFVKASVNGVAVVAKTLGVAAVLQEEEAAETSIEYVAAVVNVVPVVAKALGAVAILQEEEAEAETESSTA